MTTARISVLLTLLTTSVTQIWACPPGWGYLYDQSCYGASKQKATWVEAQTMCFFLGGHLAEVNTDGENTFLLNIATQLQLGRIWIGTTDMFEEGTFTWSWSGVSLSGFNKWAPGNPSNTNGNENCVNLWPNGLWNDEPCEQQLYFICEKELY